MRMLTIAKRSAKAHHPLDFIETQPSVSGDAGRIVELSIAGNLLMTSSLCVRHGRAHERPTNALPLTLGFYVPTACAYSAGIDA